MRSVVSMAAVLAAVLSVGGCGKEAEKMFLEVQKLDAAGSWKAAADGYRDVADKYPKSEQAVKSLYRAGDLYEQKLSDRKSAAQVFRTLKGMVEGKPEAGEVILRLGKALESGGSPYKESLECFAQVRKQYGGKPESARALLATGRIYEVMQDWAQARAVYEEATGTLPESPERDVAWGRLQSVWLLESLGLYFSGKTVEGAKLAGEALARPLTVTEVKRGLEVLLRRNSLAGRFQACQPAQVQAEEISQAPTLDASRFIIQGRVGEIQPAPEKWEFSYDKKRKTFTLKERKAPPPDPKSKDARKSGKGKEAKPWTFRSSAEYEVSGLWWSMDGAHVGWAARARGGSRRVLEVLDLESHRKWTVTSSPSGGSLGEVMVFIPRSRKLIYPFQRFMVVSDIRGGSQSFLKMRIPGPGASFKGASAKWLACSADGLEVAAGIGRQRKPAKKGEKRPENQDNDDVDIWRANLGLMGDE